MFSPGTESAHELGRVGDAALIPTRFVWPYGGKRVFLTGSFTRWSEHLPMSPVEGCPTVFQAICRLHPGVHQYKFFVDGEWKHDERQPFVMGNYGIVNTLIVESEQLGPTFSSSTGASNNASRMITTQMDVDNDFPRLDGPFRAPENDILISRRRVCEFLSQKTAYDLLPDSGKVIALDVNLPVKQSFHILHEQGIPVAPLWDSYNGRFVGILSPLDFILILRELEAHGPNVPEEELETHTISAWKDRKQQLYRRSDRLGRPLQGLAHASPYDSLKDVAVKILQNEVSMVPIVHSSSDDGSFPQLLHLASLSGILKCICRYFRHSASVLPVLQMPVTSIPLGSWVPSIGDRNSRSIAMLRPNASLSSALSLLVQAGVSSIPIVDENDSLVDTYSRSDITALAKDKVYAHIRLDEMSVQQALQLGQDASSPYGLFNEQRCQMCLRTDPLLKVMERLANPGVRRVFIVEAGTRRVEGIISLGDVFRFLMG
ncbi:5'-AMP-activated protein kinase subunit gamma [Rhynchospora pubera]|uniref:5'-AMP-activated protein kinase subunit gamma n=1 Tax=Rhynchospora pubera TaxID=906938 RepID=A0AAV8DCY6_9POAL|nr:5'-AMP-activated protein kinase subunit gamma [Rhynchospora pubera]KAJ4766462.1 5'-AMP-activated protein kinase subunit gamma [Rhynchospora pubera]